VKSEHGIPTVEKKGVAKIRRHEANARRKKMEEGSIRKIQRGKGSKEGLGGGGGTSSYAAIQGCSGSRGKMGKKKATKREDVR